MLKKLFLLFLILLIPSTYAIEIHISPEHPKVGDTITISGTANPNENINCQIWFEINPMEYDKYYGYVMSNVDIPVTPNNFKVVAENVNNLYVSAKMGIWVTKSATANANGTAILSQSNVPVGTYDIKIGGIIKDQSKPVKLKIIASTTIKADENGHFKYSYKVNNIPAGTVVHINIGGIKKDILIESNIPSPPIITDNETNNNTDENEDNEPPKITILSPNKKEFNISSVDFDIVVEDTSPYSVDLYLNGEKIRYNKENNHYIGTLVLNNGRNTFEIVAIDKYNNKAEKTITLIYKYSKTNNQINNTQLSNNTINLNKNEKNENEKNKKPNNNISNNKPKENIVEGTIVKCVNNATLIIHDGTKISKDGEIQIKKVPIPNVTLAYYITPNGAEFSIPLTLKVKINKSKNTEIKVLYYDEKLKSWINIPYTFENDSIVIKINKAGYYAIKENTINKTEEPTYIEIFKLIKIIIITIFQKIFSIF